jgi:hypothetical protein
MQLNHPDFLQSILDVKAANLNTERLSRFFRDIVSVIYYQIYQKYAFISPFRKGEKFPEIIFHIENAIAVIARHCGASASLGVRMSGLDSLVRIGSLILGSRDLITSDVSKHFMATNDLTDAMRGILRVMSKEERQGLGAEDQSWASWRKFRVVARSRDAFKALEKIELSLRFGRDIDGEDAEPREEDEEDSGDDSEGNDDYLEQEWDDIDINDDLGSVSETFTLKGNHTVSLLCFHILHEWQEIIHGGTWFDAIHVSQILSHSILERSQVVGVLGQAVGGNDIRSLAFEGTFNMLCTSTWEV